MNITNSQSLTIPITKEAHHYAEQFASEQATIPKGKQVYLNTLAVCAVHNYLQWLSIENTIHNSDCWHPNFRAVFNVADINLPSLGKKLECLTLVPGENALVIPPEAIDNRIGYLAVQFSEQLNSVQLLGFLPAQENNSPQEIISLTELKSLDALIDTLHGEDLLQPLRKWFEGVFQSDWQPVEVLNAASSVRKISTREVKAPNQVSRAKIINWENEPKLILVVRITETTPAEIDIRLRFYPFIETAYLTPGLKVAVLDEWGASQMEDTAKQKANWIQLDFSCSPGDLFRVKMTLEEMSITEQFIV